MSSFQPPSPAKQNFVVAAQAAAARKRKPSRGTHAYQLLKAKILDNDLPPGFQATESEIADYLGMSRTPVREALIHLQGERLVEIVTRRGVRVLPVSPVDMREIYQLLAVLEPEAAAAAAAKPLNKAEADELKTAMRAMEASLRADDLRAWANADDYFHRVLLRFNDNTRLSAIVSTLFDQVHRARMVTLYLRKKPTQSTREHRKIMNAVIAGDAAAARALFRAHRERADGELLAVLRRSHLTRL